ncbi:MAG: ferredoxin [Candidatus Shapirobacteria bacterium]|jgi:ferredoxin
MKKIIVNQDKCIGCNTCPLIDPEVFALDQQTYKAIVIKQPETIDEKVDSAVASCPVGAITIEEQL